MPEFQNLNYEPALKSNTQVAVYSSQEGVAARTSLEVLALYLAANMTDLTPQTVTPQVYRQTPISVAALAGISAKAGDVAKVNNATSMTFGAIVAGGGTNTVPVYFDGTNWRIG